MMMSSVLKFLRRGKGERREEMKNLKVKFHYTDGRPVTRSPESTGKSFFLKSPIDFKLNPGASMILDLGLSCSHALQVLVPRASSFKMEGNSQSQVFDSFDHVKFTILNTSSEIVAFDIGQIVCRAFVLDNSDVEVEE